MEIQQQKHGEVAVLKPQGPLVGGDSDQFQSSVLSAIGANMGRCIVDLTAVTFTDSRGLEALLNLSEEVSAGGQSLKLCGVNKTVRQVLELTDLVSHFEYYENVNDAIRSML